MRIIRPKLILILETEIWPNFLWEAERNSVPVVLVNGRLSDRSFSRYKLFRSLLPRFTSCLMQSDQDRSRMEALAIYKNGVEAAGNLKFDFTPSPLSPALRDLLCDWKKSDLLWIAGSTMEGEEPLLLHVLKELSASYSLKLLLAPRHPERFSAVYERASLDHVVLRRSEYGFGGAARPAGLPANSRVMILDSIGELAACYEFADIVTIGGTFRSGGGGHNPIEPAYFGKAILAGENFRNFRAVFDEFRARDAILITSKLKRSMASLLRDPERRQRLGRNAKQLLIENQGATERAMSHIEQYVRD